MPRLHFASRNAEKINEKEKTRRQQILKYQSGKEGKK